MTKEPLIVRFKKFLGRHGFAYCTVDGTKMNAYAIPGVGVYKGGALGKTWAIIYQCPKCGGEQ